ncbi:MAG TPA: Pr6Pr family membrane protein [Propionicimonas sp.]|jgi:hypothetical protein
MTHTRVARALFGATSLIVTLGLVLQLWQSVTGGSDDASFASTPDRIIDFFSLFTVLSNIAVAVTTGLLAIRLDRPSTLFRTLCPTPRIVLLAVIAPVAWIVHALARVALVLDRFGNHYYPYPFMDVGVHGYPVALLNVAIVAVLFLALSLGTLAVDRRLPAVRVG